MSLTPEQRRLRAQVAASSRWARAAGEAKRTAAGAAAQEALRDLRASRLEQYVREVVDAAPPLSLEQRDRIAALLRPTGRAAAAE